MPQYTKFLVTHTIDGKSYTNAFIIANNYSHSLEQFKEMFQEAKKDFPNLEESEVECRTVIQSAWCKKCPCLYFRVETTHKQDWLPTTSIDVLLS